MSNPPNDPYNLPLCDIVMEGGITSGIIYPKAVVKLSEQYRIKNIGGTSAGAIAAAATAAAELGRLKYPKDNPGYKRLAGLSDELKDTTFSKDGSSRLQNLFQPQDETRPLFIMLISALNQKSKKRIAGKLFIGALRAFPCRSAIAFLTPILIAYALGHQDLFTWILTLLASLVLVLAVLLMAIWNTLKGPMVDNGYGICKGYDRFAPNPERGREPLTLWLSKLLNECAGKAPDGDPLTFGELWEGSNDEKSKPPGWLMDSGLKDWHYVDLQMMTTNVTHGRPYLFPYKDNDQKLFFKAEELINWFPENVVDHMVKKSDPRFRKEQNGEIFYLLPYPENLPVVFATRLSLSFPFLLCAVPLHAINYDNEQKMERCWFSDGGISSNFPIHLFDKPLPMWPTFGIKLERELSNRVIKEKFDPAISKNKYDENRFFFPETNSKGRGESWAQFDERNNGDERLMGFAIGLLDAARLWRDRMLTRAPGVRDRVVRIYLKDKEGGLNLNMEQDLIHKLSEVGEDAGDMLIDRFSNGSTDEMNFDNHRWIRLRNLAAVTDQDLSSLSRAISTTPPGAQSWSDLISPHYPKDNRYPVNDEQARKLDALLDDLYSLSTKAEAQPCMYEDDAPKRTPAIRIVPNV
jgi:predicted acylesterase/phospholipase RssA